MRTLQTILFITLVFIFNVRAQDTLIFTNGNTVPVNITRVNGNEIYFTTPGDTSTVLKVSNFDLTKVIYANGEQKIFATENKFVKRAEKSTRFNTKMKKRKFHARVKQRSGEKINILRGLITSTNDTSIILSVSQTGNNFYDIERKSHEIKISQIESIKIRRRNSVGAGFVKGVLGGFLLGGVISYFAIDYGLFNSLPPEENAIIGGTLFSFPGFIIGGLAGSASHKYRISGSQRNYENDRESIARFIYESDKK